MMITRNLRLGLLTLSLAGFGCQAPSTSDDAPSAATGKADDGSQRSWRDRIAAQSKALEASDPRLYATLSRIEGLPTRAG